MCEIPNGVPMGHSTFRPLNNSRDQYIYWELLEDNNIDALHTLGVCPIRNYFWQYPLCNIYCLRQPDEWYQLLLGLVEDLMHWVLKYRKAGNVNDQFDNRFTSGPQYPGLLHTSNPSIHWNAAPGEVKGSIEWSEHRQWIVLQCLPAPRMMWKLWRTQPSMN